MTTIDEVFDASLAEQEEIGVSASVVSNAPILEKLAQLPFAVDQGELFRLNLGWLIDNCL